MEPTLRDSVFGLNVIKELPENFFAAVLACEVKLKQGYNKNVLNQLLNYYSKAIEYYESKDDPKYLEYSKNISILLTQPEIAKHFKKEKEHPDYKLEIKKKFDNRDKAEDSNKVHTLLRQDENREDKVNDLNGIIDQDKDNQLNAFQKRKENKKKKHLASDKSGGASKRHKTPVIKIVIESKDVVIDKSIETSKDNRATGAIQSNVACFLNEWSSVITNKLMPRIYEQLESEYIEKETALLNSTRTYSEKLMETDMLMKNEGVKANKEPLALMLKQTQEQMKSDKADIEKKYSGIHSIMKEYIVSQLLLDEEKKAIETKFKEHLSSDLSTLVSKD